MPSNRGAADLSFDDLPFLIVSLTHSFRALADQMLVEVGLRRKVRPGTGALFYALAANDGCNIKLLIKTLRIPNATLSGMLDVMEEDGMVERRDCPDDGRAYRLHLTRKAKALVPKMLARHRRVASTLQQGMSGREVKQFKSLMQRASANLRTALNSKAAR